SFFTDSCHGNTHRVDYGAAAHTRWCILSGCNNISGIFNGSCLQQGRPVKLLKRPGHPFSWQCQYICTRIDQYPRNLWEAQIVAGLHANLQSVEFQELWRFNFTGCDPLGFLVAKGVIEMHFSIGCNNFTAVNTDQGIKIFPAPAGSLTPAMSAMFLAALSLRKAVTDSPSSSSALSTNVRSNTRFVNVAYSGKTASWAPWSAAEETNFWIVAMFSALSVVGAYWTTATWRLMDVP